MADVIPFRALRPRDDLAGAVIAPPYDVLTEDEARALSADPRCFVRVTRPDGSLPQGTDPHSDLAYQTARTALDALISEGVLVHDTEPTYYFYGQAMGDHRQVGILAAASVAEYDDGVIKKHELTRPDKEDDRTHHMSVLEAQVGLVFLTHRADVTLASLTNRVVSAAPAWRVTTKDGVEHALWPAPAHLVEPIREAFARIDTLYIADGHHRSAAASRYHALHGTEASRHFLAGIFPDDHLYVMAYNRHVHDLAGHTPADLLAHIRERFAVTEGVEPIPTGRGHITMYLDGRWYGLEPLPSIVVHRDPVARLDVAMLQRYVLGPLLGIDDPRTSKRITFIGGIRGDAWLSQAVDAHGGVAFHLHPTGLDQLFAVADAGEVMPPKSTWFEPKLRGGVVAKLLRE